MPFNTDLDSARGPAPEDVEAPKEVIMRPEPDHAPAGHIHITFATNCSWLDANMMLVVLTLGVLYQGQHKPLLLLISSSCHIRYQLLLNKFCSWLMSHINHRQLVPQCGRHCLPFALCHKGQSRTCKWSLYSRMCQVNQCASA